ncbi:hypothetical protein LUZ60_016812 [Juncus effusus]|nr:hypothetical protein LUZ60_016812 [Juncus effusus]
MDLNNNSPVITDMPYLTKLTGPRRKLVTKIDGAMVSGWIEAMRCSSPPRKRLNLINLNHDDKNNNNGMHDNDTPYGSWLTKCPSALTSFDQIIVNAKGRKIALFLDYDGTLSHIVNDPDKAVMTNSMRATVKSVARYFPTAIVSGRSRDKVFGFVKLTELYYAGSHGMDIMVPNINSYIISSTDKQSKEQTNVFQPAREFLPMIDEVFRSLVESTKGIKGSNVENNKFCVSVHYRNVDEKDWNSVVRCVNNIVKSYPRLKMTHGRKVLEIRPVIDWDKGKAVEFLLESLGLNNSDDVLPIYIGDDRTDEDAFKLLRKRKCGYGILVSSVPKETDAFFSLRDPSEVMEFLKSLVRWKKYKSLSNEDNK